MKVPFSIITAAFLLSPPLVHAQDASDITVERRTRRRASAEGAISADAEPVMVVVRQLEHADARDISHILSEVIPPCSSGTRCRGGTPWRSVAFEPVARTNQLVIRGDAGTIELVDGLLETLDIEIEETRLIRAQWRIDPHIAIILDRVLPDLARVCGPVSPHECAGASPERIQLISVAIDPDSGNVVAYGDETEIDELSELLDLLD